MTRWEYLIVDFFPDLYVAGVRAKSGSKHKVILDGRREVVLDANWPELRVREHGTQNDFAELPQFVDYLNNLGAQGWEMVTATEPGRKFVFKRPVD